MIYRTVRYSHYETNDSSNCLSSGGYEYQHDFIVHEAANVVNQRARLRVAGEGLP